jgi:hypothetical protein
MSSTTGVWRASRHEANPMSDEEEVPEQDEDAQEEVNAAEMGRQQREEMRFKGWAAVRGSLSERTV